MENIGGEKGGNNWLKHRFFSFIGGISMTGLPQVYAHDFEYLKKFACSSCNYKN